jgi:hypothetical protein
MARSLTVNHDEKPATNVLLNMFLLVAVGWLTALAFTGWASEGQAATPEGAPVVVDHP